MRTPLEFVLSPHYLLLILRISSVLSRSIFSSASTSARVTLTVHGLVWFPQWRLPPQVRSATASIHQSFFVVVVVVVVVVVNVLFFIVVVIVPFSLFLSTFSLPLSLSITFQKLIISSRMPLPRYSGRRQLVHAQGAFAWNSCSEIPNDVHRGSGVFKRLISLFLSLSRSFFLTFFLLSSPVLSLVY